MTFIKNFESEFTNPFKNDNTIIIKIESYLEDCNLHFINNIRIFFYKNLEVYFFFDRSEIIDVLHIINFYNYDPFSYDPDAKLFFNDKQFVINDLPIKEFLNILNEARNVFNCNYIKIIHSKTPYGENAFSYNSRGLFFYVVSDKLDSYYLDKEIIRRKKNGLRSIL